MQLVVNIYSALQSMNVLHVTIIERESVLLQLLNTNSLIKYICYFHHYIF